MITVDGSPLDWRSLAVRNHSPTGTGVWLRRLGSGPARAGHPADCRVGGRAIPPAEWSVIAPIEADRWVLDAGDILGWLESAAGTNDVVRQAEER